LGTSEFSQALKDRFGRLVVQSTPS
jgi:hypothetical protein